MKQTLHALGGLLCSPCPAVPGGATVWLSEDGFREQLMKAEAQAPQETVLGETLTQHLSPLNKDSC